MYFNPMNYASVNSELFIGNLDELITEEILFSHFMSFGKIIRIKIYRHLLTRKSLGYGFIMYAKEQDAMRAKQAMNRATILKSKIQVCLVDEYNKLDKNANILIKGLPKDLTDV